MANTVAPGPPAGPLGSAWRSFDLVSLRLFVDAARLRSLSRAARAHQLSQPSASARVAGLERLLGLRLLERGPTGSRPTAAGRALLPHAAALLEAASALEACAADLGTARGTGLRVASSFTVAEHRLPAWVRRFREQAPGAAVEVDVANSAAVADRVRDGRADLGFVEGADEPAGLCSAPVGEDELVVVVAPRHRWARHHRPIPAGTLAAGPLVLREPGSGTREVFELALARALGPGGAPTGAAPVSFGSAASVRLAVRGGLGAAALSRLNVADALASGELVEVPVAGLDLRRTLRVVWRARPAPEGAARAFLRLLLGRAPGDALAGDGPRETDVAGVPGTGAIGAADDPITRTRVPRSCSGP